MWLAVRYGGQKIAPMRHRQNQLGFDGAYHYRELFEAHPELERGPDEDIEHHFNRLKAAEKIEPKLAALAPVGQPSDLPDLGLVAKELGSTNDAIKYRGLVVKHPLVERGPDQTISDHFARLQRAETERAEAAKAQAGEAREKGTFVDVPKHEEMAEAVDPGTSSWANGPQIPRDLGGMPRRIPGLNTGDSWAHSAPPEWIPPPESLRRRTPGTHYVDPALQAARPQPRQQTRDEWVQGLADKGIYLNPDGSRMTPEQMQLPLRHPGPNGPRVWQQFVDSPSYGGRHRAASKVVVAYVMRVLSSAHDTMIADGWELRGNNGQPPPVGMGAWYQKQFGGNNHVIVRDNGGWIHNSGPDHLPLDEYGDAEMTGTPMWFDELGDAVMHAKKGTQRAQFKNVTSPQVEDSSYHPERTEGTRPMGKMIPPAAKGKYQTLSFTSWEEGL